MKKSKYDVERENLAFRIDNLCISLAEMHGYVEALITAARAVVTDYEKKNKVLGTSVSWLATALGNFEKQEE